MFTILESNSEIAPTKSVNALLYSLHIVLLMP